LRPTERWDRPRVAYRVDSCVENGETGIGPKPQAFITARAAAQPVLELGARHIGPALPYFERLGHWPERMETAMARPCSTDRLRRAVWAFVNDLEGGGA